MSKISDEQVELACTGFWRHMKLIGCSKGLYEDASETFADQPEDAEKQEVRDCMRAALEAVGTPAKVPADVVEALGRIRRQDYEPVQTEHGESYTAAAAQIAVAALEALNRSNAPAPADVMRMRHLLEKALPFIGSAACRSQIIVGVDAGELYFAIDEALTRAAPAQVAELREWALNKSALHHRLAHENEHLRTEHIASSTAYRELAFEIDARASLEGDNG